MSIRQIASAIGTGHLLAPLVQITASYAEMPQKERFRQMIIDLIVSDGNIELVTNEGEIKTMRLDINSGGGINMNFIDIPYSEHEFIYLTYKNIDTLYYYVSNFCVTTSLMIIYPGKYDFLIFRQLVEEILLSRIDADIPKNE